MSKYLSWLAVILWMCLIFYFSHQPATASSELSTGITEFIEITVEKVAPNANFITENFHHIVRKNAHFFIYLVLGVLILHALKLNWTGKYRAMGIALFICVLYAMSDEVHQLFVPGRGAQVKDVLIDSAGATLGVVVYSVINRLNSRIL
ncbi:VanZ family protein [Psychrobacillus glaciei]|uniref:VanZ family protein n=1 Tax=Psychrobacillus glaciei TaxID=2283160 RepID=A0A5J6SMS5_9BACI|nr:VanZ family protein [Psychrobacillus glaciei]QFF98074.1 VanZ family protein [Psychrobacillus glaciei]